jgi:hypothetical protein
LTESKYGRNGTEVTINNSSSYITGNAGNTVSAGSASGTTNAYNTTGGILASTTGNITGIYDMSGGAWEYVTGYITNSGGSSNRSSYGGDVVAGTETESTKYRTAYPYDSGTSDAYEANYVTAKAIYGDGVYETSTAGNGSASWHSDYSHFPYSSDPFFIRGGHYSYGANAGVFAFSSTYGDASGGSGRFRVVLALY